MTPSRLMPHWHCHHCLRLLQLCFSGLVMLVVMGIAEVQGQEPQAGDQSDHAAVVQMTDSLKFDPAKVTIQVGQTVKWVNEPSTVVHTVTAVPDKANNPEHVQLPEGAEPFNSGEMQAGDTFTHTFTVAGSYKYCCIPHERAGMIGEIEVQQASQGETDAQAGEPPVPQPADTSDTDDMAPDDSQTPDDGQSQDADSQKTDAETGQASDGEEDKTPDPSFFFGAHAPPRPPEHEQATGFWKFVYWLGNFHPAATDLPVGIILAGFFSEILLLATGKPAFATITRFCVWVGGITAFATALLGWCLAGFQFYDNAWMLTTHRVLGTVTGIWGIVLITTAEAAHAKDSQRWIWGFRSVLLIAVILIVVTGYFGGAMIYGLDHYDWPDAGNAGG